nr:winged helix-turn-helix transcriptional regulator [Thermophilibacter sp. ET337]
MEADGLVHREVFAEVPPRVEYSLTPLGQSLAPVIDALKAWGEGFKAQLAS